MSDEQLMLGFIHEAESAYGFEFKMDPDTEIHMISSDHGYTEWLIAPLSIVGGHHGVGHEAAATIIVEDAGEGQRRFVTTCRSIEDKWISVLVHSYFMSDVQTYEISEYGIFHRTDED